MSKVILIVLSLWVWVSLASGDQPNYNLESRFHNLYKNFHSQPTGEGEWLEIIQGKTSDTYQVMTGDTLWGISETFFGTGHFWPKLWQLNVEITNPHSIKPGQTVRFWHGTIDSPPAMEMQGTQGIPLTLETPEAPEAPTGVPELVGSEMDESISSMGVGENSFAERPIIPPPAYIRPVLRNIPESLPNYAGEKKDYSDSGFSLINSKPLDGFSMEYLSYFITETPPPSVGKVVEVESRGRGASIFEYVYIESEADVLGKNMVAYRAVGDINLDDPRDIDFFPIENQGTVKVIEKVNDSDNIYRAIVIDNVNSVQIDAKLYFGQVPKVRVSSKGPYGSAEGIILGGRFDAKRFTFGVGSIVFLGAGLENGVKAGQRLTIFKNIEARQAETEVKKSTEPIGTVKILHTSKKFSTALIIEASDQIVAGDKTGPFRAIDRMNLVGIVKDIGTAKKSNVFSAKEYQVPPPPKESNDLDIDDSEFENFDDFEGDFEDGF